MKLFLPDTTKNKELTTWNMDLLNPTLHGGGALWPPLSTLKPHSSNRKAYFGSIFIQIWSHGYQLWPRPKKFF